MSEKDGVKVKPQESLSVQPTNLVKYNDDRYLVLHNIEAVVHVSNNIVGIRFTNRTYLTTDYIEKAHIMAALKAQGFTVIEASRKIHIVENSIVEVYKDLQDKWILNCMSGSIYQLENAEWLENQ